MAEGTPKNGGDLVTVGRITGAHGIRGELSVESQTDFPERFDPGSQLLIVTPGGKVCRTEVLSRREHKGRYLLVLEGVGDRSSAERLRGGFLKVHPKELPELPPGEFYHFQLLDLRVVTEEGEDLGTVGEIIPTGSNLVLAVRGGKGEILLPYIEDVIRRVDLGERTITVHLLEGLRPEG